MKFRLPLSLFALLLISHTVFAQFPGAKGPKRMELGYNYCLATATYKYSASIFNESTGILQDTSYSQKVKSKGGFGVTLGYTWPVAHTGDHSCMAISLAYYYDAILWESGQFSYSSNSQTGTSSVGSGTIEMGLPVGVDYKFGCDALADKSERFCYTFGTGVYPSLSLTVYKDNANAGFRMLPYLKGEVGVFAGICFKVRAMYTFGNIKYIDYKSSLDYSQTSTSFKGKSALTLSLILMPFSWKFNKSEWWN